MPKTPNSKTSPKKVDKTQSSILPSLDLESLVTQQITRSSNKRKTRPVVHSDSEIEVLESPPSKKKGRTSPPAPGSPAYSSLPPVAIRSPLDGAVIDVSVPLALDKTVASAVPEGRPKRTITKTAKAKVYVAASKLRLHPSKESTEAASLVLASPRALTPSDVGDAEVPTISSVLARLDALHGAAVLEPDAPSCVDARATSVDPGSESGTDSNVESDLGQSTRSDDVVSSSRNEAPDDPDSIGAADDDATAVMSVSCQDPFLAPTYLDLPHLPRLCEVIPFSPMADSLRTPFTETCKGMLKPEVETFLRGLMFVYSTPYVNTARADSELLYVENRRLRLKDKKCLAIGIMTGTVTELFLLSSCESGPRNSPYQVHKITIAPLDQDMRRDVSMWGQLFQFHVIAGMVSPLGISFTTRGEGKGESWKNASAPSSPSKGKSSVLKPVSSSFVSASKDAYNASLSFDQPVPVYDGRPRHGKPGFGFTDMEFRFLLSMPRYCKGTSELPSDSIVSVGYTLAMYAGQSGPVLSSNIQFVILLAVARQT